MGGESAWMGLAEVDPFKRIRGDGLSVSAEVDTSKRVDVPGGEPEEARSNDSSCVDPSKLRHGAGVGDAGLGGLSWDGSTQADPWWEEQGGKWMVLGA